MKIDLEHPSAVSAGRSDKKKQPWEIVAQSWKVQSETKGRFVPSFSAFLEYASRCYIPVGFAHVEWKMKSRILLAVAVPATYKQISAALSVSEATASKIINQLKSIGCKYESQLLLIPAVNQDLYEILDDELSSKIRESRKGVGAVFGSGKKSAKSEAGDVEPVVLDKLNRGSEIADRASEVFDEQPEPKPEEAGDRIARCREIGEGGLRVLF